MSQDETEMSVCLPLPMCGSFILDRNRRFSKIRPNLHKRREGESEATDTRLVSQPFSLAR